jgi:hypothetical protein
MMPRTRLRNEAAVFSGYDQPQQLQKFTALFLNRWDASHWWVSVVDWVGSLILKIRTCIND